MKFVCNSDLLKFVVQALVTLEFNEMLDLAYGCKK